jgi:hypothetical protein
MNRISVILKQFISERIPQKATNIFWQLFNGVEAMFVNLEYRLDISKRERNILTAQNLSSLRNLSAQNGFEPKLKVPAKGLLSIKVNPKLFNRCGYPLFLPAYSIFTDKTNNLNYYYNSDKSFRLSNNNLTIPVIEGEVKTLSVIATSDYLNRFYLSEDNVAENSITVEVNGIQFLEVQSFFDNNLLNDDKQFCVKFSNDMQNPIILYIKGLILNDSVNIVYRLTSGEFGNIDEKHNFNTENIIDNIGNSVDADDNEITIVNLSGFEFGSNGTDENSLRASIGYNHGKNLLFDNTSYTNFIMKYSTLLIQNIINSPLEKSINNIYLLKKQSINIDTNNSKDYIQQYKDIIDTKAYLLSKNEKISLDSILEEFEFSLSSHNIFDGQSCNFAFQISMETQNDVTTYSDLINSLIYSEFSKFLYIKNYVFNAETIFESFMLANNIKFDYMIFNELIENQKISQKIDIITPYIIKHDTYLPILKGNFSICDSNFNSVKLFFDINMVSK